LAGPQDPLVDPPVDPPSDTTPPADVSGLSGTAGNGAVTLRWTDPADADLDHIEITFSPTANGVTQPVSVDLSNEGERANSTTINGLTNGTEYTFTVTAVYMAENRSTGASTGPLKPAFLIDSIDDVKSYLTNATGGASDRNPVELPVKFFLYSFRRLVKSPRRDQKLKKICRAGYVYLHAGCVKRL
jgi:hypothetical protein